jgi:hypothetical protein
MRIETYKAGIALAGLWLFASIANAGSPIKVHIDFSEGTYESQASPTGKTVVIDSVTIDRVQPEQSGEPVEVTPEFAGSQIGWLDYRGDKRNIVLKNVMLQQFVRDAVSLGFDRSGYQVVADDPDAIHVDVAVPELWMWVEKMEGSQSRRQFHFAMTTDISSNTDGVADIGAVRVADYRNGSRATSWKSYRNTIMHSMKAYTVNFSRALQESKTAGQVTDDGQTQDSISRLSEQLQKLDELRAAELISAEEYSALRQKAIDEHL